MKFQKSFLLAIVAFAFMAVGTTSPAFAQFGGGDQLCSIDGECFDGCYDDSDCYGLNEACVRGICQEAYCGRYVHYDEGPTVAVFDVDPGNYVAINGGPRLTSSDMNQSYSRYCDGGCGTSYRSLAALDAGACGTGNCPAGWEWETVACEGCGGGGINDNRNYVYHENRLKTGKYQVVDTGKACSWSGGIVVELLPCNC